MLPEEDDIAHRASAFRDEVDKMPDVRLPSDDLDAQ